ncbi:MAG: hypothetical protein EXR71_06480 [Myxococcales bacterium]|nr:hypothetical protein [Myxococcales bacterium]
MRFRAIALVLAWLLGGAGLATAAPNPGPRWEQAPEVDRPDIPEPPGGWTTELGLHADVHGTWPDRATLVRLANHAATSIPALAKRLGVLPGPTTQVYVVPSEEAFRTLQPGSTPEWADGTAWPRWSLIFLKSPSIRDGTATSLSTVLDHELVHVLLGQAFGRRPVPRWLQEGMAQFYAGEATWERRIALASNEYGLEPLPLATITTGFPRDAAWAHLAYAQSADFIAWVAGRAGEDGLRTLVRELVAGRSTDDALRAAVGLSVDEADAIWRARLPISQDWYRWVTNGSLWWGTAAGFLALAAWQRKRRAAVKLARWEAEEVARVEALLRPQEQEGAQGRPIAIGG